MMKNVKNYNITNETTLELFEVVDRITRIFLSKILEFNYYELEQSFAFKDGILFNFKKNCQSYDIRVYYDLKYKAKPFESEPETNLKKITISVMPFIRSEIIKFRKLDWIVIKSDSNVTKLILKDVLNEKLLKKLCEKNTFNQGNRMYHYKEVSSFNYARSKIKNVILPNFKDYLNIDCELDLISKKSLMSLPKNIIEASADYWTKTIDVKAHCKVIYVTASGEFESALTNSSYAIRPTLTISTNLLREEIINGR